MRFPDRQTASLTGHNGPVHCVTFSAGQGQYILTGAADRTIRLFNPAKAPVVPSASVSATGPSKARSAGLIQTYEAHGYEVLDLAVTEDNARFASVGGDRQVFLWDVSTARTLRRWSGHGGRVNAVTFGGDGASVVVSGSYDATVRLWDCKAQTTKPIQIFDEARDSVSAVAVRGHEILTGSVDGRLRSYDLRMGMVYVDVVRYPITSLTPTSDASAVLVSTLSSAHLLLDRGSGGLLKRYTAPAYVNTAYRIRATLGLNDSVMVSGSEKDEDGNNGGIWVWDSLTGEVQHRLEATAVVSAVAWNGRRNEWASAAGDTVSVWGQHE